MTDLKCPYCTETRPSRSRLQSHVDAVHRHADTRESLKAAVLGARTVKDVASVDEYNDRAADAADLDARMAKASEEIRDLKAKADAVVERLEALDRGDVARSQSLTAEWNFRDRVRDLGGVVLELEWKGNREPHRVLCPFNHDSFIRPVTVAQGLGICNRCGSLARQRGRSDAARTKFLEAVAKAGGEVLTDEWLGTLKPHRVRCASGHVQHITPKRVLQGRGICNACTWTRQDTLYVVFNDDLGLVKFGVTGGDVKVRLGAHATDGYHTVLMVQSGLGDGVARDTETETLRHLKDMGAQPVQGREYFEGIWAPVVLDLIQSMIGNLSDGDWS